MAMKELLGVLITLWNKSYLSHLLLVDAMRDI